MEVNYFFRSKNKAYSIEKVFKTIIEAMPENVVSKNIYMPRADASPISIVKNILFTYKNRNKHGINHVTGDIHYCILGLIGSKVVLTIHDLVFIKNARNPIDRFFKWVLWLYIPAKIANKVVCISEKTKLDLLKYVKVKNVSVIYNPVDPTLKKNIKEINDIPVILHIGVGWNKNLERVINAISGINCQLRIIGKIKEKQLDLLNKFNINYSNAYSLSDQEIADEYRKCDIVSFPSLYEGFGMPIIEGQIVGRAVLTSQIEPMTEIGNDAVHYVNPYSIESIADGFKMLIINKEYRENLINTGLINVEPFKRKNITYSYFKLYNILLK
ncbi:glycosyltransferase [Flavobacterium sp. LM4]|uniref:glycosyltransferase n=1 Tax=Flavobacterium sp. LM4 TaxID=1938609 RepID=UPI000991E502|nr:glycosyltransferase [Flavobacterium sp. LM4]OOV18768.1 hypothetical protein BXU10_03515 [Flavobacterium sp. LM4]